MDHNQPDGGQAPAQGAAASVPPDPAAGQAKVRAKRGGADQGAAASVPEQVELAAPHGFIDADGNHRFWPAGAIVKAEAEIKLLLERMAPLVGITHKG